MDSIYIRDLVFGVGNYILAGVLQSKKNRQNGEVINDDIHISSMMSVKDVENKNRIRRKMIEQCSSSIIVFGYGDENSGTYQEYNIAKEEEKMLFQWRRRDLRRKRYIMRNFQRKRKRITFLGKGE